MVDLKTHIMPINTEALLAAGLSQAEIDVLIERENKRNALRAAGITEKEVLAFFDREDQALREKKRKERDDDLAAKELAKAIRCPKLEKPPADHLELLVYLKSVTRYIQAHHPSDQLLVSTLLSNMKGKPYEKLDTLSATVQREHERSPTWAEIEQSLLDAFGSKTPHEDNRKALYACYWKSGTLADHVGTFKFIYERVIADGPMPDIFAIDHFLKSIRKHYDVYEKLRLDTQTYQAWTQLAPLLARAEIAFGHLEASGKGDDHSKKQKGDNSQHAQRVSDSKHASTSHHTPSFVPRGKSGGRFSRGGSHQSGRSDSTSDARGRGRGRYAGRSYRGRGDGGRQSANPSNHGRGRGNQGGKPHLQLSEEARTWLYENNRCFNCCKLGHSSKDCWGKPSLDELPQDKRTGCQIVS